MLERAPQIPDHVCELLVRITPWSERPDQGANVTNMVTELVGDYLDGHAELRCFKLVIEPLPQVLRALFDCLKLLERIVFDGPGQAVNLLPQSDGAL
jgi:hypothetical protein